MCCNLEQIKKPLQNASARAILNKIYFTFLKADRIESTLNSTIFNCSLERPSSFLVITLSWAGVPPTKLSQSKSSVDTPNTFANFTKVGRLGLLLPLSTSQRKGRLISTSAANFSAVICFICLFSLIRVPRPLSRPLSELFFLATESPPIVYFLTISLYWFCVFRY